MPFSPLAIVAIILLTAISITLIQVGILTLAFDKLGLSADSAIMLLMISIIGSAINLPLFKVTATKPATEILPPRILRLLKLRIPPFKGYTTIALNVGGGLVPIAFCFYLLLTNETILSDAVIATALVSGVSYFASRPIPGLGIGIPVLVAPLSAAIIALIIGQEHSAPLAYIAGTMGVLIGADILRLKDIQKMGTPIASIGGAGTFDGIFITGIVAAILA